MPERNPRIKTAENPHGPKKVLESTPAEEPSLSDGVLEGLRETVSAERTRNIAEQNREDAAAVPDELERPEFLGAKKSHDPLESFRETILEDPTVPDSIKEEVRNSLHFEYRVVFPKMHPDTPGEVDVKTVSSYHDLLKQRAALPKEFRETYDMAILDKTDNKHKTLDTMKSIGVYDSGDTFNHLDDPTHPLSKYRETYRALVRDIGQEQLIDEYAEAVARGEIEPLATENISQPETTTPKEYKEKISQLISQFPDTGQELPEDLTVEQARRVAESYGRPPQEPAVSAIDDSVLGQELAADTTPEQVKNVAEGYSNYFNQRSTELNQEAEKKGFGTYIRSLGEQYNTKLGRTSKLLIGAGLGLGAAASITTGAPIAYAACMAGVYAQRTLGGLGMFVRFENSARNKKGEKFGKWDTAKSAFYAAVLTVGMGLAIKEAVHLVGESSYADAVHDWLKSHWPFGGGSGAGTSAAEVPAAAHLGHPEVPNVSVDATPGHGYEYMMKHMWEQLQGQHLNANDYAPDSDIHKLLMADAGSIDKVVHQIASDPNHGFYNPDGTSVLINAHSHMSLGPDGQVHFGDSLHPDVVQATPDMHAHTTPEYHPHSDASVAQAEPIPEAPTAAPHVPLVEQGSDTNIDSGITESAPLHSFMNGNNLEITPGEPHIYADEGGKHLFVYGGTPEAQSGYVHDYLREQAAHDPASAQNMKIWGADGNGATRIPYGLDEQGKLTAVGTPPRTGWYFFNRHDMPAPDVDEFHKIIK